MEKNYVEIQGRFSSDGMFVGGNYVPEVIDKLMNDVYSTLGQAGSLYRLRFRFGQRCQAAERPCGAFVVMEKRKLGDVHEERPPFRPFNAAPD